MVHEKGGDEKLAERLKGGKLKVASTRKQKGTVIDYRNSWVKSEEIEKL